MVKILSMGEPRVISYKSWWAGSAGKRIEKTLKKLGMRIAKPHASAIVTGSEGPLQDGMEELFEQIGGELQY